MPRGLTPEARSLDGLAAGRRGEPQVGAEPIPPVRAIPASAPVLEVRAPLSGVIVPLDLVPDPVFARRTSVA